MKKNEAVYISGPITGDPDYKKHFAEAEKFLRMLGYKVKNPAKGEKPGKAWEYYMVKDLKKLLTCRAIYLLRGWERSRGARLEQLIAQELGFKQLVE